MLDTETSEQYELVFDGQIVEGRDHVDVRSAFVRHFGENVAQRVFGASSTILKRNLSHGRATKMQKQFRDLGMETRLSRVAHAGIELSLVEDDPVAESERESAVPDAPPEPGLIPVRSRRPAAKQKPNKTLTPAEIDECYSSPPGRPASVSSAYRVHLAIVALLMILLPLVYIGVMATVVYATWWHASANLDLFDGSHGAYFSVIFYVVPLISGGMLALFFLKPLVAGNSAREPQPVRLDPDREPSVFHLVDSITDALGAPMPGEILVDADVNASASLRRGAFSKELTLTIGMPLFYGMRIEELTGILAHEFGHFAQRYGMRFGAIIHYINYWFYRQAYMDDGWDDMIDSWAQSENIVATLSALIAQLGAFVVRLLLMLLAHVATLLSRGLSRHMEFDADRYQVELTGSSAYAELAETMRVLAAGHETANELAAKGLQDGHLPDNIPALTAEIASSFDQSARNSIFAEIQQVNGSAFDTHPPDLERIAAANKLDRDGVFRCTKPALSLVREPERLGKHVTLQWYRAHELEVEPRDLMTNDTFKQRVTPSPA